MDELQKAFTQESANLPPFILKDLSRARLEWFLDRHEKVVEGYISSRKNDLKSKRTLWDRVSEWLRITDSIDVDVGKAKSSLEEISESAFPSYTVDMDEKLESVWKALPAFARKDKSTTKLQWFFDGFAQHQPCVQDVVGTCSTGTRTTAFIEAVGQWLND